MKDKNKSQKSGKSKVSKDVHKPVANSSHSEAAKPSGDQSIEFVRQRCYLIC